MTAGQKEPRKRRDISPEMWEAVQRLTLMDDALMTVALDNNIPCVEEMLRIILDREDLTITSARTQVWLQGVERSVCLDVEATGGDGERLNIEFQRASEGADPRRPRFHCGMIDIHSLKPGQDFKELPECYVIFVTEEDVLGGGKSIYTVHRYIDGAMTPFNDGSHIIYVNGAAEDDGTELWKLIHDLQCPNPEEMFLPRLAERVRHLKEKKKEVTVMTDYFDRLREEAVAKAVAKTEKRSQENFALKLLRRGKDTFEEIAECTGLTLRRVKTLAKTA